MKTKMPKCIVNASFYWLKRTIYFVSNYWISDQQLA
jgi:hypothetical protein